jgi:hypothetical protein
MSVSEAYEGKQIRDDLPVADLESVFIATNWKAMEYAAF